MSYGMTTGALSRGRSIRVSTIFALAVATVALLAITFGTGTASAAFTANGFSLGATTTQAGGHPAVTLSASNDPVAADANGDDLKSLQFDLPAGMMLDPRSVPTPCPTASFNADNCAAATQVGTISLTYRAAGKTWTSPGEVYSITPDSNSLINFGIVVRPWSTWQKFKLVSGPTTGIAQVRTTPNQDYGLSVLLPTLPRTVKNVYGLSSDLTISNVELTLNSRSAWTSYPVPSFVSAPTRCSVATTQVTFASYANVIAKRTSSYAPSGCDKLSFDPFFDFGVTNTVVGRTTGFSAKIYVPDADQDRAIQSPHVKDVSITLETGTSINPSTSLVIASCTDAQLAVDACPANTKIGSVVLAVPQVVGAMTGDIYKTGQDSAVQLAFVARGPRGEKSIQRGSLGTVAVGTSGSAVVTKFPALPQVPWTSLELNVTSRLVNNAKNQCPYASGWGDFSTYSGNRMLYGMLYPQTGCPPETTITSTTPSPVNTRTPSFTFSATPADSTFECSVDYGTYTSCASGFKTASLADGNHTFGVRAVYQGVADPSPAQRSFTVAMTAPDTALTSTTPKLINTRTPSFTFSGTPAGATFECSVDYATYASCASGFTATALADGEHTFMVRATSQGVVDPSPAQVSFTVDVTPPTFGITFPATGDVYNTGTVTPVFAVEATATGMCGIDTAPATPCVSGQPFSGIPAGAHKLVFYASDAAGNISTKITRSIRIASATGPKLKITAPVSGSTLLTDELIPVFTATSPIGTAIASTECRIFTLQFKPSINTYLEELVSKVPCDSGQVQATYETGKLYRLKIVATDAAGDVGIDAVDFIPAVRAPVAPAVLNDVNHGTLSDRTPTFKLEYYDKDFWPNAVIDCALTKRGESPVWSRCGTGTNLPDYVVSQPLSDGEWIFRSRASAGAVVGIPAEMDFTVGDWSAKYTATTTTQKAGAHPDLDIQVTPTGAGQFRAVDITLPKGLIGSLNSFPKCTDLIKAKCPANTKVGSVLVKYGIASQNGLTPTPGDVYLTGPQGPNDAAGMVINVYGPVDPYADTIIPLHIELINNAQQMRVYSDTIPTLVGDVDDPNLFTNFWVFDFKMHIDGSKGSPFPLLTNPSRCAPGVFTGTFGDTEGTKTPAATVPYQATDCGSLPFAPTISQTFSTLAAGEPVGLTTDIHLPAGNSSMSSVRVAESAVFAPNYPSFGRTADRCPGGAVVESTKTFDPTTCNSAAIIGTMSIDTPLLPTPLTGSVYLVNKTPLPFLGVKLDQPGIAVRLYGATNIEKVDPTCGIANPDENCPTEITVKFENLPDVPLTDIHLDLNRPDRQGLNGATITSKMLALANPGDETCTPTANVRSAFTPYSGTADVKLQQLISISGC